MLPRTYKTAETVFLLAAGALLLGSGCLAARPTLSPTAPLEVLHLPDGGCERIYDTDGDNRGDYGEHLSPSSPGRIVMLRFDTDGDGTLDLEIERPGSPAATVDESSTPAPLRLLIIADSIPFEMVRNLYAHGRFRLFHPPSRVISPFPVMTDVCLNELFGTSPAPGVETEYYDGRRFHDGFGPYTGEANSPWLAKVDYHLSYSRHDQAYLAPYRWFDQELADIERTVDNTRKPTTIVYAVGTSALGIKAGRDGHAAGLLRLDRFCQALMCRFRGQIEITLMSDHGHNLGPAKLLALKHALNAMGYRVTQVLQQPQDVVVPAFGIVDCAAVYTASPARVARDLTAVEGVELSVYRGENGNVIVVSRNGMASVSAGQKGYKYDTQHGDPLKLASVLEDLQQHGLVDAKGFIDDDAFFRATVEHPYPDSLRRLHRAFHGLVEHTPDVLVSLSDGWCWGSPFMARFLTVSATHGALSRSSSTGFVMSTAAPLPDALRMEDVADALRRAGAWTE